MKHLSWNCSHSWENTIYKNGSNVIKYLQIVHSTKGSRMSSQIVHSHNGTRMSSQIVHSPNGSRMSSQIVHSPKGSRIIYGASRIIHQTIKTMPCIYIYMDWSNYCGISLHIYLVLLTVYYHFWRKLVEIWMLCDLTECKMFIIIDTGICIIS